MKTLQTVMIMVALILVVGMGNLAADPAWDPGSSVSKPDHQTRVIRQWTGFFSPMWNNANNWTPIGIPTPVDDVIIGGAILPPNLPMISSPGAYCHSLVLNVGMILMITPPGTLHVYGQIDNYGNIDMHNQMTVDTHLIMHPDSYLSTSNPAAQLTVNGNCTLETDSDIMMNAGTFIMSGAGPGILTNNGETCSFFDVFLNKTGSNVTFSAGSSTPEIVTGSLTVGGSTTCSVQMTPTLLLAGNLQVNSGGHFYGLQGEVCCNGGGTIYQTINFSNTDSYFNHLRVLGGVSLLNNILIYGNIYLDGGNFSPGLYTVYLKGNWYNNAGPSAFSKGSSRVTFNGPADQSILLSLASTYPVEEFHILEVSKATGTLLLNQPGQVVICDSYDWSAGSVTVVDGTLTINSLADVCITGKFVVNSNGLIRITSAGSVSFNCDLYIYGGAVYVYGGTSDSQWPGSSPGSITMSGGLLYFHDVGVSVDNTAISFTENISGGTIRVNGGFYIGRPDFHPSGGTIEFVGSNPATIGMVDGACFHNVLVNKAVPPPPDPAPREPNRDTTLYSATDLDIQGSLGVESGSGLDLNHYVDVYGPATVSGSVWVRVSGDAGNPSLDLHNGVDIEIGSHWELVAFVWVQVEGPVPYPAQDVDGEIDIEEDAKWESCSAPMNVGPTGSIVFVAGGGGGMGGVRCPGFSATYPGTFVSTVGTLELTGSADGPRYLNLAAGNHCCNLLINSQGPIVLQNDCDVLGDLHIQQGTLDVSASNYAINLHGNWTDDAAPTGFEARNGTVSFLGSGSSDIDAGGEEESFFDVIIDKSGSMVTAYGINGTLHVCGDLDVHVDSFFDVYTEIEVDGDLDLWGDLRDNDCDVVIHGYPHLAPGSELQITVAGGRVLCDAPSLALPPLSLGGYVWIQDGTLEVTQMPVSVASSGNVYFYCSGGGGGGRIKCPSFQALTPGTFVPDCGTLELTGTAPTSTHYLNIAPGNHAHDLLINDWLVVLQNDCDIYGDLHIQQGILDVSPSNYAIKLRGSWTNDMAPTGFEARNGTVTMLGSGNAYINAGGLREEYYNLNIAKSGGGRVNTNCELQINGSYHDQPDSFFDVFFDIDIMQNAVTQGYIIIHGSATVLVFGSYDTTPPHHLTVVNGGHLVLNAVSAAEVEEEGEVVMEQGSLWESNAPLCVTTTGSITFTDGGGGGSGACIACPGFTALTPGSFVPAQGTLEISSALGAWPQHLNIGSGNHAFNLVINSSGPVSLDNDCDIWGDLHIIHGPLDVTTANREIRLYGSWTDDVAPLGFEARNGTVRFLGGGAGSGADISSGGGEESFFDVIINKPAGTVTSHCGLQLAGDLAIWPDSFFDVFFEIDVDGDLDLWGQLEVESGVTATVNSLPTLGVASVLIVRLASQLIVQDMLDNLPPIYAQGIIILEDGTMEACNQPIEVASSGHVYFQTGGGGGGGGALHCCGLTALTPGTFAPSMGTLEIHSDLSGLPQILALGPGNNAHDLSINTLTTCMLGHDLSVTGNLYIVLGDLDASPSLHLIMLMGDWTNISPNTGFLAREAGVHFVGSGVAHISTLREREEFHNLIINKSGTVILDDHVCTTGDGVCDIIQGTLYVNDYDLEIGGSCTIGNGAMLHLDGGTCAMADGRVLNVNNGGTCKAHGNRNRESKMKGKEDTSRWKLKVNSGGHISAKQTEFKHLREEGVKVYPGGIIDPDGDFDECKFNSGAPGCTFLTLDNSQDLIIDNIEFISSSGELHNIAKLENAGHILVESCSGNFAGPLHELDPHSRVDWVGFDPNLVISGFEVSDPDPMYPDLISYTVHVLNDSDYPVTGPFNLHLFLNRDLPPELYEAGDLVHSCGPLPGHGVCSHTFTDVGYLPPDIWHSWAYADPENVILEEEEWDNLGGPLTVTWRPLPNLVVTEFTASDYNPFVCDTITYHVEIQNQSTAVIITGINLRRWNPDTQEYEDHWIEGPILGWGVVTLDFEDSSAEANTQVWIAIADPDDLIEESNEADNQLPLPEMITWSPLPPVGEISITRLSGDLGRLTWSYPIWVSRFRIYHGDDPYGDLDYLGHTIDSFFDVYLSDPKDFYLIRAERDAPPE